MVFGGSGFIGSNVVDAFVKNGAKVSVFDLVRPQSEGVDFVEGNILDSSGVTQALAGIDFVFNFAGISDLDGARKDPLGTSRLNIEGCINILNGSVQNRVKKFILASTLYTLGNKGNFYRCSKLAAELYVKEFTKIYGLRHTILHFGTVYGNRSNQRNGIYSILYSALYNNIFIHNNDLDSEREYIHVLDTAKACTEIISEEYDNQSLLIAGSTKIKKSDLHKLLEEMLGKNLKLVKNTDGAKDHYMRTPFSFPTDVELKFIPNKTVDFQRGIFNLLSEIRNNK